MSISISHVRFLSAALGAALLLAAAGAAQPEALPAKTFRAGAATSNITPALGSPIVGGWSHPPSTHVHDELHVRCLALSDGSTTLAFAVVDNVSVPREVFDQAKELAREATGIPPSHMMMSATHSHSAVSARGSNALASGGPLDDYQRFLIRRIADGIRRAVNNLEPARIGWGSGQVPQWTHNRRWLLKDGKTTPNPFGGQDRVLTNPGSRRGEVSQPAGPTNPEVYFISVQSLKGRPIALLGNYWMHYAGGTGASTISADYFAAFSDRIQELLGADRQSPPFVGIMANGPCGDVTATDNSPQVESKEYKRYERIGLVANDVAQEVARVHRTLKFHDWVELKAAAAELDLKMRRPSPELVTRAQQILARPKTASPLHARELDYARRTITAKDWPESTQVVLQTFRIGTLGIAAIPFETFAETGLEIKSRSPFQNTFTIELANGGYGYLPTPEQHKLGGYETWLGTSRVEEEASRKIVAQLMELFARVK